MRCSFLDACIEHKLINLMPIFDKWRFNFVEYFFHESEVSRIICRSEKPEIFASDLIFGVG
jgi:hypothetical protein